MEFSNSIINILLEKGFNKEFAMIYSTLLNNQEIQIDSIQKEIIELLIELRVVVSINSRIILIDPKITFPTWKNELKWAKQKRNVKLPNKSKLLPNNISILDIEEIESVISKHYNNFPVSENVIIGMNEGQITHLICNSILKTTTELRAISIDTELTNTASIWGVIEPKVISGLKYTRICDLEEILIHGVEIKTRDISIGVKLFVLNKIDIKEKMYAFDHCSIFIYEAFNNISYNSSGQLIHSDYLSEIYLAKFNEYLEQSLPAIEIINRLKEHYNKVYNEIDNIRSKDIYKSICDYGAFSEHQNNECVEIQNLKSENYLLQKKYKDVISILVPSIPQEFYD